MSLPIYPTQFTASAPERLVFVDGKIIPSRVTITGAEEESMTPTKKPIAKGCLAQRS